MEKLQKLNLKLQKDILYDTSWREMNPQQIIEQNGPLV